MSESTVGGPAGPGPSDDMSAADLAHLVVDSAAERQLAAESMPEFLFPEDMLPGAGEDQITLREGLRTAGARAFIVLAIIVTLDNLQTSGLAVLVSQHPVVLPRLDRGHHLRGGDLGRIPRFGHPADGLAGRPLPAPAHHRLGHPRVRADGGRDGLRHEHLRVLPGPPRCRHLAVEYEQRPRVVAGGYLSDQRARPDLRRHGHGPGPGPRRQSPPGGSHRHRGGRPQRLALGLLHPGHPHAVGGGLRLSHSRAAPRAVREEGRARGSSSATHLLPRPRSRRPSSGSCASARSRRS